jgi:hypothetical protein
VLEAKQGTVAGDERIGTARRGTIAKMLSPSVVRTTGSQRSRY